MIRRGLAIAGAALLVWAGSLHPAAALRISPFKTALDPERGNSQVFHLENNSDESAAVQISVETWEIAPDGTEINKDAEDEFTVFPAQLILKPHERRAVRVQWLGGEKPQTERAYRVLAEQIPVTLRDTSANGSGLRFLLRFKAGLYIAPAQGADNVIVEGLTPAGSDRVRVTLRNKGSRHTLIRNPILTVTGADGHETVLKGAALESLSGSNIHAGSSRYFDIPVSSIPESFRDAHLTFESAF